MKRFSFLLMMMSFIVAFTSYAASVALRPAPASAMNLSVVIEAEDAIDGVIYNNQVRFRAEVTNNGVAGYNNYVEALLFVVHKDDQGNPTGGEMVASMRSDLSLSAGETQTLYFDFDDLAYGQTYTMNLYAYDDNGEMQNLLDQEQLANYDIRHGLVVWTSADRGVGVPAAGVVAIPADAIAVSLEGLDITAVKPNANPNTIYLIGVNEAVPAGLEQCNVVCGDWADRITLCDGYPYFTPKRFVAAEATYERTLAKSRRPGVNTAWSTIVLPFTPDAITAGGQELTLCDADDADNGQLWVERLAAENDGLPAFECVTQMEANVPYLIAAARAVRNKAVTWHAANVLLESNPEACSSSDIYLMAGVYVPERMHGIFVGEGTYATLMRSAVVPPFRAYFKIIGEGASSQGQFYFPGESWTPAAGDVNFDGDVDIDDVNVLVNIILNYAMAVDYGMPDVTGDGNIDIDDVNAVINIILR